MMQTAEIGAGDNLTILGQFSMTGKGTSDEQPNHLKNAHPWTSVAERNSRILWPTRPHGSRRKSFVPRADGVFGRDRA